MSPKQIYGEKWERKIKRLLEKMGYTVEIHHTWNDKIDLVIDSACLLHVKAARPKKHNNGRGTIRNRFQFNFSMVDHGHCIVAICDSAEPVFFIIPTIELKLSLNVTSSNPADYSGWAEKYKNNWQLLKQIIEESKIEERVF